MFSFPQEQIEVAISVYEHKIYLAKVDTFFEKEEKPAQLLTAVQNGNDRLKSGEVSNTRPVFTICLFLPRGVLLSIGNQRMWG